MKNTTLETLVIHEKHTDFTVIFLHGLGADGHNFAPLVQALQLKNVERIKFIFPNAPERPVTLNNGYVMRAWYDLYSIEHEDRANLEEIHESIRAVHQLIDAEIAAGTPAQRIVLAGYSQGAVIALFAGINFSEKLAGIIALSGYAPHAEAFTQHIQQHPPIFLAHGKRDTVVPYLLFSYTQQWLNKNKIACEAHEYDMAHEVAFEEIQDLRAWLMKVMDASTAFKSA